MSQVISCTVPQEEKAEEVVTRLRSEGFSNSDISILYAEGKKEKMTLEEHSKAPEGATAGVGVGGVIGAILGWFAGIGSLAIPGLGPFIAAGPIMSALSGCAIGVVVGGIIGSLVGLGIPEFEAKQYESKLKDGHVLISVRTADPEQQKRIRHIFQECSAENVSQSTDLAA